MLAIVSTHVTSDGRLELGLAKRNGRPATRVLNKEKDRIADIL